MEEALGATVKLVESSGGVFEITVDGHLVYSKKKTGEFPEEEKLLGLVRKSGMVATEVRRDG